MSKTYKDQKDEKVKRKGKKAFPTKGKGKGRGEEWDDR